MVFTSGEGAKSLTTLGEVNNRVKKLSRNCWDDFIPVGDISFQDIESVHIAGESHPLKSIAQRSISNRLGIPYNYIRKCPRELQAVNLNHWITQEKNEELFLRFDGDEVRAVFTPKYKPVDNAVVMSRLSDIGYDPDTEVKCSLDSEFMTINIPDGNKTFSVNGDKITPGISLSNSEVGLSSLRISVFYLRLICTNSLIAKTEVAASYRHVSKKILDELPNVLANVSHGLLKHKDRFRLSVVSKVDNPQNSLKGFNRQFLLNEIEQKAVEWAWPMEVGNTMYNIIQTYTRAAEYPGLSAESSYRLSKVGGDLLLMLN